MDCSKDSDFVFTYAFTIFTLRQRGNVKKRVYQEHIESDKSSTTTYSEVKYLRGSVFTNELWECGSAGIQFTENITGCALS